MPFCPARVAVSALLTLLSALPAQAASTLQPQPHPDAVLAEARAYAYTAALSLPVAMVNNEGERIEGAGCNDPRLVIPVTLRLNQIEFCTASVSGEHEYEVQVRFKNGLAFIADQDGVRQVDAAQIVP